MEAGGSHMNDKTNQEGSIPIRAAVAETSPKPVSELLHEDGMVKELVGKVEEKVSILERFGEENLIAKPDFMEGLQWETVSGQGPQSISEGSLKLSNEDNRKVVGPASENPIPDPLAMSFDDKKGWVAEHLGPASKHWKRLARESNKGKSQVTGSPTKGKREAQHLSRILTQTQVA